MIRARLYCRLRGHDRAAYWCACRRCGKRSDYVDTAYFFPTERRRRWWQRF